MTAYLEEIDTPLNYLYLIAISVWSTVFVESWKRKQNTIKYLWALEEKRHNIKKSVKREQKNAEYVVERISGQKRKLVLNQNPQKDFMRNLFLILGFGSLAVFTWWVHMKFFNQYAFAKSTWKYFGVNWGI